MKLEEVKIIRMACIMLLTRGLEIQLIRETIHNIGASDNTVLNRKTRLDFWPKLYRHLRRCIPDFPFSDIFDERSAAALSSHMTRSPQIHKALHAFLADETGLPLRLPDDLLADGNFLFSLAAVHGGRLFRLARFFTRHWGSEQHEPAMRLICQKLWFFYLIAWGKITISEDAFNEQKHAHELGILSFIIEDYRTFTGILYMSPPSLRAEAKEAVEELVNVFALPILYPKQPQAGISDKRCTTT